jgi:hypothetical protein
MSDLASRIDKLTGFVEGEPELGVHDGPERERFDELDLAVDEGAHRAGLSHLLLPAPGWPHREYFGRTYVPSESSGEGIDIYPTPEWRQRMRLLRRLAEAPAGRLKPRIPRAEAEVLVRDWLEANAKGNPAGVTRDAVVKGTGVSAGQVSKLAPWKAFLERRAAATRPTAREIPLTDAMQAALPSDCETPDVVAELIEEQNAEAAEQERRRKRRHRPS